MLSFFFISSIFLQETSQTKWGPQSVTEDRMVALFATREDVQP